MANTRAPEARYERRVRLHRVAPTTDELTQEAFDEPWRGAAKARKLSLHRQFNGLYYFLDGGTLIKNGAGFYFTRDEAERFLSTSSIVR